MNGEAWVKVGQHFVKSFTCPRCGGDTAFVLPWSNLDTLLPSWLNRRAYRWPDIPAEAFVRCLCTHSHDGRPPEAGERGCGQGAIVDGPGPNNEQVLASKQLPAYHLLSWQTAADQADLTALSSIRSSAEKWGATIGALTGIFSLIALIRGPGSVSGLTAGWADAATLLLFLALALAFLSIFCAAVAAQGRPARKYIDALSFRRTVRVRVKLASRWLAVSRWTTGGAALLLMIAIIVTWQAPQAATRPTAYWIFLRSGSVECGNVKTVNGRLQFEAAGQRVYHALTNVARIEVVNGCP